MVGSIVLTLALALSIISMIMYFLNFRGYKNTINYARIAYHKKRNNVSYHKEKVVQQIIDCRSEKMGRRIAVCQDCGYEEITFCSCRNRNCPSCQNFLKEKWVLERKKEIINSSYFHLVFTLPEEFETIAMMNEEVIYNLLFKVVSETLL